MKKYFKHFQSDPLYLEWVPLGDLKALAWAGFLIYPSFGLILIELDPTSAGDFWPRWMVGAIHLVAIFMYESGRFSRAVAYRVFTFGALAIMMHMLYVCHLHQLSFIYALGAITTYALIGIALPTRGAALLCLGVGVLGGGTLVSYDMSVSAQMFFALLPTIAIMVLIVKTHYYTLAMDLIYTNEVKSVLKDVLEFTMDSKDLSSTLNWALQDFSQVSWCGPDVTLAIFVKNSNQQDYLVREVARGAVLDIEEYRRQDLYEVPLTAAGKNFGSMFVSLADGYIAETTKKILLKTFAESLVLLIDANFKALEIDKQQSLISHSAKMIALGEMAGGIAHEINTPLATISIDMENLRIMKDSGLAQSAPFDAIIDKIGNTVQRMAKIIKGLRTFARDASRDDLESTSVDLIVDDTLNLCHEKFKKSNVRLIRDTERQPDLKVKCQKVQIDQILLNLLSNAFDAVEKLAEDRRYVRIEVSSARGVVALKIFDGGEGLSPEARKRLFQPFFTTKAIGKGTGLGLSISKGLIEAQKGSLYYETASSETCFVIELPAVDPGRTRFPQSA